MVPFTRKQNKNKQTDERKNKIGTKIMHLVLSLLNMTYQGNLQWKGTVGRYTLLNLKR